MRTMKNTYCVEVAFLNTDSDDINVEYLRKERACTLSFLI